MHQILYFKEAGIFVHSIGTIHWQRWQKLHLCGGGQLQIGWVFLFPQETTRKKSDIAEKRTAVQHYTSLLTPRTKTNSGRPTNSIRGAQSRLYTTGRTKTYLNRRRELVVSPSSTLALFAKHIKELCRLFRLCCVKLPGIGQERHFSSNLMARKNKIKTTLIPSE